jgi:SAM-dependent methyltransferase
MHETAYIWVRDQVAKLPDRARVVEIGGRDINGSVRGLFPGPWSRHAYTSVDLVPGRGVDVVADGATFTPREPPDTVVCCEVLEHAPDAEAIVRNAHAMLCPGGALILTTATTGRPEHSAVDGGRLRRGEFYRNVRRADLERWLSDFAEVEIVVRRAPADIYALATKAGAAA